MKKVHVAHRKLFSGVVNVLPIYQTQDSNTYSVIAA